MRKNKIYMLSLALSALALTTSCDDFLDTMPDDRAEVNTETKVTSLLVSAYPTHLSNLILEVTSDNVLDNGQEYSTSKTKEEAYRFEPITSEGNDDPKPLWNSYYGAVAAANQALQAIDELGNPASLSGQRAEALLCRAYSMYCLATTFCMAYNPDKADEYMGLPYPTEPETTVNPQYERGTLRQLYENINKDIEEALPNVSDDIYTQPKYHFNQKAAYAFAARFNLYYMNYDKVIQYANAVLGTGTPAGLRDYTQYLNLGRADISNQYINSSDPSNLLLVTAFSLAGRALCATSYPRFSHGRPVVTYETFWAAGPWGTGANNNTLYFASKLYGSNQSVAFPKMDEMFEYTDKTNGTGYAHIVDAVFTTDETLLCRAEAYALKKDYAHAISDINAWITSHTYASRGTAVRPVLTEESINTFMDNLGYEPTIIDTDKQRSIKKTLHPQGFTVEEGTQENIIELILHMRRLETIYQGLRIQDLKRYGIEFSHPVSGEKVVPVFKAGDLRGAIQLPNDVIVAGLPANPREETSDSTVSNQ